MRVQPKKPQRPAAKQPQKKPRSKEEAIQQMVEQDPEKVAAMLREILKGKER